MRIDEVIEQVWVVEYSHSQRAFNVQQLGTALQDNLLALLEARQSDYSIVAVAMSANDANKLCAVLDSRDDHRVSRATRPEVPGFQSTSKTLLK